MYNQPQAIIRDPARLNVLHHLRLLDSPPEASFDRYTRLVTRVLGVPIALVSLVDADRQFFKSCIGLDEPVATSRETPLSHSFCQHVVASRMPLVVDDTRAHPLLADSPAIEEYNLGAYLGMPLCTSDGFVVGTLCALCPEPHAWSKWDEMIMADLAAAVTTEIELRKAAVEQQALAKAFQLSEKRFSRISAALPVGVFVVDAQGLPCYANDVAKHYLGHAIDPHAGIDQLAETYQAFVAGTDDLYPTEQMPIVRALAGDHTTVSDMEIRSAAGRMLLEVTGTPVCDDDGRLTYAIAVFTDITARQQKDMELAAATVAANAASQAKSEFLATVSHELRTPLNSVIGMNELLLMSDLSDEQRGLASLARDAGQILLALLNDILDFSKIEAGKLELESADIDLVTTVEDTVESFMPQIIAKDLTLDLFVDPAIPTSMRGDAQRLRQILFNLVGNAVKFTQRGSVSVRVTSERRTTTHVDVRVAVTDTGIGIGEETCRTLFQPFTQGDGSMARRFGGTGLGLSICKRLLDLMGGTIDVTSSEGQGSTFWFTITLERATTAQADLLPSSGFRNNRVLLVDRNETRCDTIRQYLAAVGIDVERVSSIEQAVRCLHMRPQAFDMVFVDYSGFDDVRELVDVWRTPALASEPLVLMTPFNMIVDPAIASIPSYVGHLQHPLRRSKLLQLVAAAGTRTAKHPAQELAQPPIEWTAVSKQVASAHALQPTILIAEDNPFNQKLAVAQLRKLGYCADVVGTGMQAVEAVQNGDYTMILMDCQMPEMDGFEATAMIRQLDDPRIQQMPIIALTANSLPDDEAACLRAGMNDYLGKPVKLEKLRMVIERWLEPALIVAA